MINYLLALSACWLGFYLLYAGLLSRTTFFKANRLYLLGTFTGSFFIPLLPRPEFLAPVQQPQAIPVRFVESGQEAIFILADEAGAPWWQSIPWMEVIYILGATVALAWTIYNARKLFWEYQKGTKTSFPDYTLVRRFGLGTPFSFFRWLFWDRAQEMESEEARQMLTHEEAHIRLGHSYDIILLELAGVVFWFHPLVYLYRHALRSVHEYQADAQVLQHTSRMQYGQLLIRQALLGMPGLANHFNRSQLKKRIFMMTQGKTPKRVLRRYWLLLPVMAGLVVLFSNNRITAAENNTSMKVATDTIPNRAGQDEIFKVVEQMPLFPGCEEAGDTPEEVKACANKRMLEFIYSNIQYPETARKKDIEGAVVISFIVEKDGSLSNAEIVREIGGGCGEEALRVVNKMIEAGRWTPGMQRGRAVRVQFNLPVRFRIGERAAQEEAVPTITGYESEGKEKSKEKPTTQSYKPDLSKGEVFKVVEQMPLFPGCEEQGGTKEEIRACANSKMLEFVYSNIQYPETARKKDIEGTVVISFIVEKDGSLSNAEIVREIGGGCGEEALRVVNQMNEAGQWRPGLQRGQPVRVQFNLPVRYKLQAESPKRSEQFSKPLFPGVVENGEETVTESMLATSRKRMLEYIYKNIKYPAEARKAGEQGLVYAYIKINEKGAMNSKVVVSEQLKESVLSMEVLRVINEMPQKGWTPAMEDGKPVLSELILPVKFKLDGAPELEEKVVEGAEPAVVVTGYGTVSGKVPDEQIDEAKLIRDIKPLFENDPKGQLGPIDVKENQITDRQGFVLLKDLEVMPNPGNGVFRVSFEGGGAPTEIRIFDNRGQLVKSQAVGAAIGLRTVELSLVNQAAGAYYLVLHQPGQRLIQQIILQ